MPSLSYTVSDFTPFTKIVSADVNSRFQNIKDRFNWDGSGTTTGLNDDNIQSNTVANGGLTRATKLKAGTANHIVINDASGLISSEAQLALSRGGTNLNITPASHTPGDVLQINATSTALEVAAPSGVSASLRIFQYYQFS